MCPDGRAEKRREPPAAAAHAHAVPVAATAVAVVVCMCTHTYVSLARAAAHTCMASPANLMTSPPWRKMTSISSLKYALMYLRGEITRRRTARDERECVCICVCAQQDCRRCRTYCCAALGRCGNALIKVFGALATKVLVQLLAQRRKTRDIHKANGRIEILSLRRLRRLRIFLIGVAEDDLGGRVAGKEAQIGLRLLCVPLRLPLGHAES